MVWTDPGSLLASGCHLSWVSCVPLVSSDSSLVLPCFLCLDTLESTVLWNALQFEFLCFLLLRLR